MGFDSYYITKVKKFYLPFFEDAKVVLDLGCGRGEFLQLLKSKGIRGYGVDSDRKMVQYCKRRGLDVVEAHAISFLKETHHKFDGIFCSHLVEHMLVKDSVGLLSLCKKLLTSGGTILVCTPNPASLPMQLYEYWRDPTHVRMYTQELLEFLLRFTGYKVIDSGINPNYTFIVPFREQVYRPTRSKKEALPGHARLHLAELKAIIDRMRALEKKVDAITTDIIRVLKGLYCPGEVYAVAQKLSRESRTIGRTSYA